MKMYFKLKGTIFILMKIKKTKHAKYEDDKRKIMSHKNDANNNKKKNKNEKQKN